MINSIFTMVGSVVLITAFMYMVKTFCNFRMNRVYGVTVTQAADNNNTAFGIFRGSMLIAVALAMLGTVNGDFITQAWHGLMGVVFIYLATELSDRIILPGYDDRAAIIKHGNVAVATMVAGFMVSTGIVAYSSFVGNGPWWTSILFFAVGQTILLGMSRVYEAIHPEMLENIKKGETASGLMMGGMFVAFAMILNGAIAGDFVSIEKDLMDIAISVAIGVGMLVIFVNKIVDKLFISHMTMQEMVDTNNVTATSVMVSIKIMLAMAIGYIVI